MRDSRVVCSTVFSSYLTSVGSDVTDTVHGLSMPAAFVLSSSGRVDHSLEPRMERPLLRFGGCYLSHSEVETHS